MKRRVIAFCCLMLVSCRAPVPMPKSICDLPQSLSGWSGASVRWSGVVVGTFHHGFALASEDCQRRGIALVGWDGSDLDRALRQRELQMGLLRADLSGKIIAEGEGKRLWVTKVHSVRYQPMTEEEYYSFWRSMGF